MGGFQPGLHSAIRPTPLFSTDAETWSLIKQLMCYKLGIDIDGLGRPELVLPENGSRDSISAMARRTKSAVKRLKVRARVRGGTLELLDRISLRDGEEVLVTISEATPVRDVEALRAAAGAWRGMVDADALIANIYADRLISTRPSPSA